MARPEPMNATPNHSKAKVSLFFSDPLFVAGQHVTGKMELECKTDKDLGINVIKAELFAIQELTSRDHSATSTFLHTTRLFQGPGLPPSNAVYPHPLPGSEPLPIDYFPARKGTTTFFFRFPLPDSTPSSIDFGKGLAKLKYEVRASVGVCWKNERQLVMERREVDVVEAPGEPSGGSEQVAIGENGKLWVQGRILNPYVVAGESCCVELFVKNHSSKKNSSLTLGLTRHLHLPAVTNPSKALQISDTLATVPFRGPDYIVQPGTEGIANLVFDVPNKCRGLRSGRLDNGDDDNPRQSESLFEVRCIIDIKLGMGIGSKDVVLELPVTIVQPAAMKVHVRSPERYASPAPLARALSPSPYPPPFSPQLVEPYLYPHPQYISPPISPPPNLYPWASTPAPIQPLYPPHDQHYYYPPPPPTIPFTYPVRSSSADPFIAQQLPILPPQLQNLPALESPDVSAERQVGKGERASRIAVHLRMTSRNRSVSPQSHRFPGVEPVIETSLEAMSNLHPLLIPTANVEQDTQLLSASPRSNYEVLSPRPVLSPKHSFSVDRGTIKSDRVVDLERMAAAEEERNNKTLPARPPSEEETPETPRLPPQPTLAPIVTRPRPRPRPDYGDQGSGLEALERKLLEQVGTRKPETVRRADVRTVLPIAIPSHNDPRYDPANDSAISSLALGAEALKDNGWPAGTPPDGTGVRRSSSPTPPLMGTTVGYVEKEDRGRGKVREKRSDVHQLRKAATNRVAAWLGEIDPAIPPPSCGTPRTESPKMDVEDVTSNDRDPHPLLRSSPAPSPLEAKHDASTEESIPTRSSGFVLHAASSSDSFDPPCVAHSDSARASTPTQLQMPILTEPVGKPTEPTHGPIEHKIPKPVLKRFTKLSLDPSPSEVKYDVRSARGGRGGKVTSVASLWASLASQSGTPSASGAKVNEKPVIPKSSPKPTRKPASAPSQRPTSHARPPMNARKGNSLETNVADLTARRAKMIKSSSVPAMVSSSLATPMLSSTASLARPLPSLSKSPTTRLALVLEANAQSPRNETKQTSGAELNFGQTRLKELIKKYQQGSGQ